MNLRYKCLRSFVKFNRWKNAAFVPEEICSDTQKLAFSIIKKCISDPNASLLIAPLTNVYYIQVNNLFIKILDNYVQIINGKYYYHISMPARLMSEIERKFQIRVESNKNVIEHKIINNTNSSLRNIFNDLQHEKATNIAFNELELRKMGS